MTPRTKAEIAVLVDVRHQAVSSAVRNGRLVEDADGMIDLDSQVTQAYLQREGSQRRSGKRRRLTSVRRPSPLPSKPPEAAYNRSIVEESLDEMWNRALCRASEAFLPVECEKLATAMRKAKSMKAAAAMLHKFGSKEMDNLFDEDHEFDRRYILDGEDAAYEWFDEHFDAEGNPLTALPQEEETP